MKRLGRVTRTKYFKTVGGAVILILLSVVIAGCHRTNEVSSGEARCTIDSISPGTALQQYLLLLRTIKAPSDREKLIAFTAGELRRHWRSLSPSQFNKIYLNSVVRIRTFHIFDSGETSSTRQWYTYSLRLEPSSKGKPPIVSYPRKAYVTKVNGVWLLDSITRLGNGKISQVDGMRF